MVTRSTSAVMRNGLFADVCNVVLLFKGWIKIEFSTIAGEDQDAVAGQAVHGLLQQDGVVLPEIKGRAVVPVSVKRGRIDKDQAVSFPR